MSFEGNVFHCLHESTLEVLNRGDRGRKGNYLDAFILELFISESKKNINNQFEAGKLHKIVDFLL